MKLVIKLVIFLLLLGVVGPYLLLGPDGMSKVLTVLKHTPSVDLSPPDIGKSLDSFKNDGEQFIKWAKDIPQGPEELTRDQLALMENIQPQDNIYYRWQDENGVWQFSATPNRNTLNLVVRTDPNANVLQGMSEEQVDIALGRFNPENTNSIVENNPMANGEGLDNQLPLPTTVPMAQIPELIQQAQDVQKIMDQRVKMMESMSGP